MSLIRKDFSELHLESFGQNDEFLLRDASDLGLDFGDAVFADFSPQYATSGRQHRSGDLLLLTKLFDSRSDDVLGMRHLPLLEADAIEFDALKASNIGRFKSPLRTP